MNAVEAARGGGVASIGNELSTRFVSAAVLAVFALAGAWFGGWVAGLVVAVVAAIVHVEWSGVTRYENPVRFAWTGALVAGLLVLAAGYGAIGAAIVGVAAVAAAGLTRGVWSPAGVLYAAALGFGILLIRLSPESGRAAIFFVLAVVWGTDTGAFFAGRTLGGPKLWPAVSPKKTWSGAAGGFILGIALGLVVAVLFAVPLSAMLLVVAAVLSMASEAGDLFESWVKRRFGAKDASKLVPGHGGLMDRVDGLVFSATAAVAIAWLHSGGGDLAARLLRW